MKSIRRALPLLALLITVTGFPAPSGAQGLAVVVRESKLLGGSQRLVRAMRNAGLLGETSLEGSEAAVALLRNDPALLTDPLVREAMLGTDAEALEALGLRPAERMQLMRLLKDPAFRAPFTTARTGGVLSSCTSGNCLLGTVQKSIDEAALTAARNRLPKPNDSPGIFATISPNSGDPATLEAMFDDGLNVARVNYSHGTPESNAEMIRTIRETAAKGGYDVSVIGDVQGPKVRVGNFADGEVTLSEGQSFTLTSTEVSGDASRVSVDYPELAENMQSGDRLLLDDGNIALRVESAGNGEVVTTVEKGGVLSNRKGVIAPERRLPLPSLTDVDETSIVAMVEAGVDGIAVSFVRNPETIRQVRRIAAKAGRADIPVIAKVEDFEGLENLEAIAQEADMIMLAQGDLGVLIEEPALTATRQQVLAITQKTGTPTVIATHILDSMSAPGGVPSAIEIERIQDMTRRGASWLMLAGETAAGPQPANAVKALRSILDATP